MCNRLIAHAALPTAGSTGWVSRSSATASAGPRRSTGSGCVQASSCVRVFVCWCARVRVRCVCDCAQRSSVTTVYQLYRACHTHNHAAGRRPNFTAVLCSSTAGRLSLLALLLESSNLRLPFLILFSHCPWLLVSDLPTRWMQYDYYCTIPGCTDAYTTESGWEVATHPLS